MNFECCPSEKTLAQATGRSERHVRRLLRQLREKGVIDFTAANLGRRGHRYRLLFAVNAGRYVRNNDVDNADEFNGVVTSSPLDPVAIVRRAIAEVNNQSQTNSPNDHP